MDTESGHTVICRSSDTVDSVHDQWKRMKDYYVLVRRATKKYKHHIKLYYTKWQYAESLRIANKRISIFSIRYYIHISDVYILLLQLSLRWNVTAYVMSIWSVLFVYIFIIYLLQVQTDVGFCLDQITISYFNNDRPVNIIYSTIWLLNQRDNSTLITSHERPAMYNRCCFTRCEWLKHLLRHSINN